MLVIVITALIIVLISLTKDNSYSTDAKDSNNDILKELLQRMDKMQSHIDKLTVVMETIVEQQMVITAEIFTVSQTLPFCCCQYTNSTDAPGTETTTYHAPHETTTPTILTSLPANCAEAMGENGPDGIYQINVTKSNIAPFDVYCMKSVACERGKDTNGTWLIIQRKYHKATDFNRDWKSYQRGFGDLEDGGFWIGLDKIYTLTKSTKQELWIHLQDNYGRTAWATYSHFAIGDENEKYALKTLGRYEGIAGDSLSDNIGQKWTTFDNDNDKWSLNCAERDKGAWWLIHCGSSNLNGGYPKYEHGMYWHTFGSYPKNTIRFTQMAIRPRT